MLALAVAGWLVFLPVSGALAVDGNLAPNPGFEAAGDHGAPAHWRRRDDAAPVTFARDTGEKHGGAASARITTEPPELPAWPSYSTELGNVEEGQVYRAEAYVKTRDVSRDAGIGFTFRSSGRATENSPTYFDAAPTLSGRGQNSRVFKIPGRGMG